jgi:polyphosphate kinase 2 (PPK2 family)
MSNTNYKQVILELATKLTEAAEDADKFDRGQDAAGVRLRKLFLEISKELKSHRLNIQDVRTNRKNNK